MASFPVFRQESFQVGARTQLPSFTQLPYFINFIVLTFLCNQLLNFKNGLFDGKFTITFPNGNKGEGNWKDGIYLEDGTLTTVGGKTLKNVRFIGSDEREILSLINNPRTRGVVII